MTWLLANFGMLQRAPEISQGAIKLPGFIGHVNYMGSTVEGVINLLRLYCMVDVTNIDILKLCGVHIDLIRPNKMWSTIILLILWKCYKSQQWPGYILICSLIRFKHAFYGFTLMPLEEYCYFMIYGKDFSKVNR